MFFECFECCVECFVVFLSVFLSGLVRFRCFWWVCVGFECFELF